MQPTPRHRRQFLSSSEAFSGMGDAGATEVKGSIPPSHDMLVIEIARAAGLSVPDSRRNEAAAGIRRIMERHGIDEMSDLLGRVRREPVLLDGVVTELTVQETYFFRDPLQFEAVRSVILPALLAAQRAPRPVRAWSAGCSSGEEPYSLAILAEEEGLQSRMSIMASDISRTALEKARKAEYGDWSIRRAGASLVDERHFTRRGPSFRLAGRFRKRVTFRMLNLETDDFPSSENGTAHLDLILCRNVLMYFGTTSVRQVARKLFSCLADGGWLVVAPSDPPLWEYAPFETEITPSGVLYRRRTACPVDHEDQEAVPAPCRQSAGVFPGTRKQKTAPTSARRREGADAGITWEIRTLAANGYSAAAAVAASLALKVYPLSPDLYCLQGAAFIAEGMKDRAAVALRRAIYLDRALPEAHFLLGTVLQETDLGAAVRAFSNAAALLAGRPPSETAQLCLGETAGSLERHARERIAALGRIRGSS